MSNTPRYDAWKVLESTGVWPNGVAPSWAYLPNGEFSTSHAKSMVIEELATQLAQPDWPSEAQAAVDLLLNFAAGVQNTAFEIPPPNQWTPVFVGMAVEAQSRAHAIAAALHSVRPPAGVVSDQDVDVAFIAMDAAFRVTYPDMPDMDAEDLRIAKMGIRAALESYASRHTPTAPTKE